MRDDVKEFFNELLICLDSKKMLLNSLLENEKSVSDLIKYRNDAEDDLLKIVENSSALINEINVAEYNISKIKDEIARRYSFDFNKVFRREFQTSEIEILNFRNAVYMNDEILNEILVLKNCNNISLDKFREDLEIQISELERIDRLNIVIPKDPRSF